MTEVKIPEIEKEVKSVVKTQKTQKTTKKMYTQAIETSNGTITDVSQRLNITPSAVFHYLEKHLEMKELLANKRLSNIDRAEAEIFNQLEFVAFEKEPATAARIRQNAAQYITSRLGKSKGWVERTETEHSGNISSDSAESMRKIWEECNANKEADIDPSVKK